ncbi:MAG: hypothetical protein NWE89_10435 [Candidatus Bathyarchaeota archaeon]|nr:hypothetical protein [Candidatus Bathyarchaeota archaeon]
MFDFSEWTREDIDESIIVQGDRVSWVKANRSAVRYIGKETRVTDDYHHRFIVCIEEAYVEDELNRGLLRLWELRIDWDNHIWIYARKTTDGWTIHYEQRHQGQDLWAFHGEEPLSWGQRYAVELGRVGERYTLRVLSENGETVYVDAGEIESVKQSFDWLWMASTIKSRRNNGNWSTGYIESLILTPDQHDSS